MLVTALRGALVACSAAAIGALVVTALPRLSYPYPLQGTESASLEQLLRVLRGEPLYAAPTLQHVPLVYGPVSYYAAGLVALLTGASYLPLRLVSLVASLGSLALLYRLTRLETGSWVAGLLAAGLLAAMHPLNETALDLGRVDALFLFLVLGALTLVRTAKAWPRAAAAGAMIGLAALTKLPLAAAPLGGALGLYLLLTAWRRALVFGAAALATLAVGVLLLWWQSGPWATWYLWDLPRLHVLNDRGDLLWRFWLSDVLPYLTLPLVVGPVFLLGRTLVGDRRPLLLYGLLTVAAMASAWASRTNSGGARNVLLPTHAMLALLLALGVFEVVRQLGGGARRAQAFQAYALAVCALQFVLLAYNPRLLVPYRSEQWAADRLSARLAGLPGPIFAPDFDAYLMGTDKGEQPHMGAVGELTGAYSVKPIPEGARWIADVSAAFQQQRFNYAVLTDPGFSMTDALEKAGYVRLGPLFPPGDDYWQWVENRTPRDIALWASPNEQASGRATTVAH